MQVVNERDAITATATRRNTSGELVAPTTLDWRIDCLTTGEAVQGWTTVAAPAAEQTIAVAGALNAIRDDGNAYEDKQLTLRYDSGLSTQHHEHQVWRVRNVAGYV